MSIQNFGKFIISIIIGGLFLWLALRNVSLSEVQESLQQMSYGWIPFYVLVTLMAHYSRAVRWQQLFEAQEDNRLPSKRTLFNGVMLGYLLNYAIPRLGELSRAVYVTRIEGGSNSKTLGTVFLERIVDTVMLMVMLLFIVFFFVSDPQAIRSIFGEDTVDLAKILFDPINVILVTVFILLGLVLLWLINKTFMSNTENAGLFTTAYLKIKEILLLFSEGLLSLRLVRNWGLFIGSTILIWFGYVLLAYIPFWGFDMVSVYGLGMREAFVIMVVSAIGVALPSPGGVGTYHWFVGQTLIIVYMVPSGLAMTYAIVTHAVMFFTVVLITVITLVFSERSFSLFQLLKIQKNKE